jgi:hypothetical protein
LVAKSEKKRPLGRPRLSWKDNMEMGVKAVRWEDVDFGHLIRDRVQ